MRASTINELFVKEKEFCELPKKKVMELSERKEGIDFLNRVNERRAKKDLGKRKEEIGDKSKSLS